MSINCFVDFTDQDVISTKSAFSFSSYHILSCAVCCLFYPKHASMATMECHRQQNINGIYYTLSLSLTLSHSLSLDLNPAHSLSLMPINEYAIRKESACGIAHDETSCLFYRPFTKFFGSRDKSFVSSWFGKQNIN